MVERFEKGKKYKFSKEQFFSHVVDLDLDEEFDEELYELLLGTWELKGSWVQECDGKEVVIHNSRGGGIGGYLMEPQWCVEVGLEEDDDGHRISRGIHYALNHAIHDLNEEPNMVFMTRYIFMICQRMRSFEVCKDTNGSSRYEIFGYPITVIDGDKEIYVGRVNRVII